MKRIACSFLVLILLLLPHAGGAQGLTQRQQEILRTAMSAEGYLTPQLHKEFWDAAPVRTQAEVQTFQGLISRVMTLAARYQKVAWASARASYAARHVIRLPDLDRTEAELRASMPSPYNARFEASFASTRRLLGAAAKRSALETPSGPMFITPDLIDRVETGLDAALSRAARLAKLPYSEAPTARKYDALAATIMSPDPLVIRHELLDLPTLAAKIRLTTGEWTISENEAVMIGAMSLPTRIVDPKRIEAVLRGAIKGAQKSIRVEDSVSKWERWRGNEALTMDGWAISQGNRVAVSIRAVYVALTSRLIMFMAVATDPVAAEQRRRSVELSTHLNE